MNLNKRFSVLFLCAAVPCLLLASSSGAESVSTGETVESAAKTSDFVGSWSCEASKAEELPNGQGKLVMTQLDNIAFKAKGKAQSTGKMKLKVMKVHAQWDTRMQGDWRIKDGTLCITVGNASIKPANDDARKFEEQMGRSMEESIPTGEENCEEVVEVSPKGYVSKDPRSGVLTRCKRK